jgi:beta-lactam-binding protein with PASTA domain
MLIFSLLLIIALYFYLNSYTRHGEKLIVPDIYGMKIDEARKVLKEHQMELVVIDTLDYDPDLAKFAVREQNPKAGSGVKQGRKIYVKINSDKYRSVTLPKLRGLTLRQAKSTLAAMNVKVGKVIEKPYFAEVVLDVVKGKDTMRHGDKIPVKSVVNLIVGSGEEDFESGTDTLKNTVPNDDKIPVDVSPEDFLPF